MPTAPICSGQSGGRREGRVTTLRRRRNSRYRGQSWFSLAFPGCPTCFTRQPRAAGTHGSGPGPRATAAAAPSSLMTNAEPARTSGAFGSAQRPDPRREAFKVTPATSAGRALPGRRTRGRRKGEAGGASGPQSRAASAARRLLPTRKGKCRRFAELMHLRVF